MKTRCLKYFAVLSIVLGITSLASTLSAGESHAIGTNQAQSTVESAQIPPALLNFISQAIKQGLSIDQIVEQAVLQGYLKNQVVAACSDIMVQEVDEASSNQNTLMWCVLSATVAGIGIWILYTILKPSDPNAGRPGPGALVVTLQNGYELPEQAIANINQFIADGYANNVNPAMILNQIRQRYPNTGFNVDGDVFSVGQQPWNLL